jgi:ATP-binding cassette subfamily B protein
VTADPGSTGRSVPVTPRAGRGVGRFGGGTSLREAVVNVRESTRDRPLLRRVARLFRAYRRDVGVVAVLILITAGLGVVNPLLTRTMFDTALFVRGGPRLHRIYVLAALMLAVPVVTSALSVWQTFLTNRVGQYVMRDLRADLYGHLQSLSLRFFTGTRTGEIQSRLANDVGGLQSVITDTASTVLSNTVVLISTLVAMLLLSWQLTIISLFMLPLFVWLTGRVGRVRRRITGETQVALAEMSAITGETLSVSGMLLAKVFGRQASEAARYDVQNELLAGLAVRQQLVGRSFFAIVSTFFSVTPVFVYLVAGIQLSRGGTGISAGTIVAFTTLQARLFQPIGQLLQTSTEISSSLALFTRVFGYLDLVPDIVEAPDATDLPADEVRGEIELRSVWFSYAPSDEQSATDRWALRDLSLLIRPGQLAAIVGPSGAGKTTISYLVPRLYDTTRGSVFLDGRDVRSLTFASLSGSIGMVTQETYLFHASIRDNIAYVRPDASDEEVEAAARAAFIHDRILEFDEGYATLVGERGYRLSGGEKQRLAIARVLLKDPRVLVLDEATSALDTVSERTVQAALEPLMQGRTTIAIAHRLSTIRRADVIFAVSHGQVVERGTHDELLRLGGLYSDLYEQQFGGGLVEARCSDGMRLASGRVLAADEPAA